MCPPTEELQKSIAQADALLALGPAGLRDLETVCAELLGHLPKTRDRESRSEILRLLEARAVRFRDLPDPYASMEAFAELSEAFRDDEVICTEVLGRLMANLQGCWRGARGQLGEARKLQALLGTSKPTDHPGFRDRVEGLAGGMVDSITTESKPEEAAQEIAAYSRLIEWIRGRREPGFRSIRARAEVNRASCAFELKGPRGLLEGCEEVLAEFDEAEGPQLHGPIAKAMHGRANPLAMLQEPLRAMEAYAATIARFQANPDSIASREVTRALANFAGTLHNNRPEHTDPRVWELLAVSLLRAPQRDLALLRDMLESGESMNGKAIPGALLAVLRNHLGLFAPDAVPAFGFSPALRNLPPAGRLALAESSFRLALAQETSSFRAVLAGLRDGAAPLRQRLEAWEEARQPLEGRLRRAVAGLDRAFGMAGPASLPPPAGMSTGKIQATRRWLRALPWTRAFRPDYARALLALRACERRAPAPRVASGEVAGLFRLVSGAGVQAWRNLLEPEPFLEARVLRRPLLKGLWTLEDLHRKAFPELAVAGHPLRLCLENLPFKGAVDMDGLAVCPRLESRLGTLRDAWEGARKALRGNAPGPMEALLLKAGRQALEAGVRLAILRRGLRVGGPLAPLVERLHSLAPGVEPDPRLSRSGARCVILGGLQAALERVVLRRLGLSLPLPAAEGDADLPGVCRALDAAALALAELWPSLDVERRARVDLHRALLEGLGEAPDLPSALENNPGDQAGAIGRVWDALHRQRAALHGLRPRAGLRPPEAVLGDATFVRELQKGLLEALDRWDFTKRGSELFPPYHAWNERMAKEGYLSAVPAPRDIAARLRPGELLWIPFLDGAEGGCGAFLVAPGEEQARYRAHSAPGAGAAQAVREALRAFSEPPAEEVQGLDALAAWKASAKAAWSALESAFAPILEDLRAWCGGTTLLALLPGAWVAVPWEALLEEAFGAQAPLFWRVASLEGWREPSPGVPGRDLLCWDPHPDSGLTLGPYEMAMAARAFGAPLPVDRAPSLLGLLQDLPKARRAHLHLHGRYDPLNPFRSGFRWRDEEGGPVAFEAWMLAGVDPLPGTRVQLSSCEVALAGCASFGVEEGADLSLGSLGVASILCAAGASQVVGPLYRVSRSASMLLYREFYALESGGDDAIEAVARRLREARARFRGLRPLKGADCNRLMANLERDRAALEGGRQDARLQKDATASLHADGCVIEPGWPWVAGAWVLYEGASAPR